MTTLYANFLAGVVDDNPLGGTTGDTTITSSGFANLPVIGGGDIMWLVLDPEADNGAPEIVQITAHTASATTVTVVREEQGTSVRSHPQNTVWRVAATASDFDTFFAITEDGAIDTVNLGDRAVEAAKLGVTATFKRTTNIAVGNGGTGTVTFQTETRDTDGWWSSGTTFTCPADGLYAVSVEAKGLSGSGVVDFDLIPLVNTDFDLGIGSVRVRSNRHSAAGGLGYFRASDQFTIEYEEQGVGSLTIDEVVVTITNLGA